MLVDKITDRQKNKLFTLSNKEIEKTANKKQKTFINQHSKFCFQYYIF